MKLFEPLTIKQMEVKNRIIMPPMVVGLGAKSLRSQAYYMERAKGGAGNIMMAAISVDLLNEDDAWGRPGGVAVYTEAMQSFTEKVRETGAKIGIQIWHGNRLPASTGALDLTTGELVEPSARNDMHKMTQAELVAPSARDDMREMTQAEIQEIIGKFTSAAVRVKEAGFDYVELHGAHGYLLCQFFSGADNQRTDEYGGDVYKRMRFGLETVQSIRAAVGDDFPVFYRLGAEEKTLPGGITIDESKLFAAELEKAGVDVIDVSLGRGKRYASAPLKDVEMGAFAHLAAAIKQSVSVPVIAVGRINTPEVAESILTEGKADIVAIGRQLVADPFWPKKVMEGRADEIVACKSCNRCFVANRGPKWKHGESWCQVNDRAGCEIDC